MKNKFIKAVLTAGIMLAGFSMSALALTLPVSEDTSTSGNANVAKSAGKDIALHVSAARQGLIRFEAGAFADSVATPGALTLHRVTQDWSEHRAALPAYDAKPLATIPASSVVAKQSIIVDVTVAVQAWLREPGKDFGFAIAGSDGARVLLGAKEGPGAGHPAQLQIETGDADAAEGGRTRASATAPIGNFVTNADIVNNSIKGKKLKAASVTGLQLALETVTGANILDGSIVTAELANGSITTAKLDPSIGLWSVSGSDVFRAAGKIGIGTTSPQSALQVGGFSAAGVDTLLTVASSGVNQTNPPADRSAGIDLANFSTGFGFTVTSIDGVSSAGLDFRSRFNSLSLPRFGGHPERRRVE